MILKIRQLGGPSITVSAMLLYKLILYMIPGVCFFVLFLFQFLAQLLTFKWFVSGSSNIKVKDEKTGTVHLVGSHYISSACHLKSQWSTFFWLVILLLHTLVYCDATTKRDCWHTKLRIESNIERYHEIVDEIVQRILVWFVHQNGLWKPGRYKA